MRPGVKRFAKGTAIFIVGFFAIAFARYGLGLLSFETAANIVGPLWLIAVIVAGLLHLY